jgi:hypothetical protein
MRAMAVRFGNQGWPKIVAGMLLCVLVLSPACESACRARTCQPKQTTEESGCHQAAGMLTASTSTLAAARTLCEVREVLFALPESSDTLRVSHGSLAGPSSDVFATRAGSVLLDSAGTELLSKNSWIAATLQSATAQSSQESSLILRI